MSINLSRASQLKLKGVHIDLVRVIHRAAEQSSIDFGITQGLRTVEEQKANVAKGASQTMKSRHLTGHAVDLVVIEKGKAVWDFAKYEALSKVVLTAARQLGVPIIWGGTWKTLRDGPHFELDRRQYP